MMPERGAANAESFKSLEELVSALDAMSPEDSAGARLREEATIVIAGASRNNQSTFRKLFSMYFLATWVPQDRRTGDDAVVAAKVGRKFASISTQTLRDHLGCRPDLEQDDSG